MKVSVALGIIFLLMVLPAGGDLYSWTDADGVKHFSNSPPPVKAGVKQQDEIKHSVEQYKQWEERRQIDQHKMLEESRSSEETKEKEASADELATGQQARVVMYATPQCKYCARARAFFKKYAVSYTEYDITADEQAHQRYKRLNGNGVPLIFVGDKRVSGYNEGLLRSLLGIR